MIGASKTMQTLSLEEEIEKMDGIPYIIDFYQDLSTIFTDGLHTEMSITEVVEEIMNPSIIMPISSYHDSWEEQKKNIEFWENFDKAMEKERKAEAKWRKHHKKISAKQACRNFERIYEEFGGED